MDRSNKRYKTKKLSLFKYSKKNAIEIIKTDLKILKNKNIKHNQHYCMKKIELKAQISYINDMSLREFIEMPIRCKHG